MKKIALVSTYEAGFQPLLVSTAGAALRAHNIKADGFDLYKNPDDIHKISGYAIVAISLALFDSLESGTKLARKVKNENPECFICFYGPYAFLNRERIIRYCDCILLGEWEFPLPRLMEKLINGEEWRHLYYCYHSGNTDAVFNKDEMVTVVPARDMLPAIGTYKNSLVEKILGNYVVVGNVETSRGCHHRCDFCSVYSIYQRKYTLLDKDLVFLDIDNLVEQGVSHITFVDAEFINDIKHSLDLLGRLHEKYPSMTYDFTTRADHIVKFRKEIGFFKGSGCIAITTSFEFPSDEILDMIRKDIHTTDIVEAITILNENGIVPNPTFVMFNPWINFQRMVKFNNFLKRYNLQNYIDPIQFETRLHLYKGSPLLNNENIRQFLSNEKEFMWEWKHPDDNIEELYTKMITPVKDGEFKRCCLRC